jgi:hypothetical protein
MHRHSPFPAGKTHRRSLVALACRQVRGDPGGGRTLLD